MTSRIAGTIAAAWIVCAGALSAQTSDGAEAHAAAEPTAIALLAIAAVAVIVRQVRRLRRPRAGA